MIPGRLQCSPSKSRPRPQSDDILTGNRLPVEAPMIKVTRLNGKEFVVNAELIQFLEATPDTVITLLNHEKLIVKEGVDDIVKRVVEYNRSIRGPVTG